MNFIFDNDRPIYIQLVEQLKQYIVSGNLRPGERLPSVRELASITKVNPNTMQKALTELEDEQLVYTERTNGKFVTEDVKLIEKIKKELANQKVKKYLEDMEKLGINKQDAIQFLKELGGK